MLFISASRCSDTSFGNDLWDNVTSSKITSDKQITSFSINGYKARINGTTIKSVLPIGTSATSLAPVITHNGAAISPESGAAQNFTNPVTYTVTATDGTTEQYTVSVTVLDAAGMKNANLSVLRVKKGKLQPALNDSIKDYLDAPIPFSDSANPAYNDKQSNSLIADPEILIATMTMELESNGKVSVENATEHVFPVIEVGPNNVTIIVTAADKKTTKTYNLNMYRAIPIFKTGAEKYDGMNQYEDAATQRGVSWPDPRFRDNGDGTVTDLMTELIWLKDANLNVASLKFSYAVFLPQVNPNYKDISLSLYLPNINELHSLANYGKSGDNYLSSFFNNCSSTDKWWTSTSSPDYPTLNGFCYNMEKSTIIESDKSLTYRVWAVRGNSKVLPKTGQTVMDTSGDDGALEKGVDWPTPRFSKYNEDEDGPILDNMTGLMWFKNEIPTGKVWQENFNYIEENINGGNSSVNYGFSDWLIPNVREIETLSNFGKKDITWLNEIDGIDYFNVSDIFFLWTSTYCASLSNYAYMYNPSFQTVLDYQKNTPLNALPVRQARIINY